MNLILYLNLYLLFNHQMNLIIILNIKSIIWRF